MDKYSATSRFDARGQKIYKPKRQLLVMMLGVPGSGKSYFARRTAEALGFERFSSDAIRTELFGRPDPHLITETGERMPPEEAKRLDEKTFAVLNRRVEEALLSGRSVIRDHIHHRSYQREFCIRQAALVGALPIAVWIKTPLDLAHKRGMARESQADQINETCPDMLRKRIDYWHDAIDLPSKGEICVEVDGVRDFADQLEYFVSVCQRAERGSRPVNQA